MTTNGSGVRLGSTNGHSFSSTPNTSMKNDPQPATVAGLVLVGANPNRFLPQAGIDAVACFGPEKDYDARERRKLCGPIVRLQGADGAVLESGLPEQAVEFIRRNIDTVTLEDGIRRREQ